MENNSNSNSNNNKIQSAWCDLECVISVLLVELVAPSNSTTSLAVARITVTSALTLSLFLNVIRFTREWG